MIEINLVLPEGYLTEETRTGYLVSSERKELWAIEMDLLMQLDKVCKKHNLHYCVGAGTLLGTIRHKGFIPWDDDMDVYMLRHDYDKLMRLTKEFEKPYFLQNIHTEKNQIKWFARLRNVNTTGTTFRELYSDVCKGIFIDIFPLDGITEDKKKDQRQLKSNDKLKKLCKLYNATRKNDPNSGSSKSAKKRMQKKIAGIFLSFPKILFNAYDHNLKKYSLANTKYWGNRTLVFECPKSRRPLADYQDLIMMPFEFIEVPVPRNYDSMLRQQYGDYMQIPEKKGENMHGELIVSTEFSFDDPRRTLKQ